MAGGLPVLLASGAISDIPAGAIPLRPLPLPDLSPSIVNNFAAARNPSIAPETAWLLPT